MITVILLVGQLLVPSHSHVVITPSIPNHVHYLGPTDGPLFHQQVHSIMGTTSGSRSVGLLPPLSLLDDPHPFDQSRLRPPTPPARKVAPSLAPISPPHNFSDLMHSLRSCSAKMPGSLTGAIMICPSNE